AAAPVPASGSSRPSKTFFRTSWAADLMSCIIFRTRVPAALFPPSAFCTSGSASTINRFKVSNSCIDASHGVVKGENCTDQDGACQTGAVGGRQKAVGRKEKREPESEARSQEPEVRNHCILLCPSAFCLLLLPTASREYISEMPQSASWRWGRRLRCRRRGRRSLAPGRLPPPYRSGSIHRRRTGHGVAASFRWPARSAACTDPAPPGA